MVQATLQQQLQQIQDERQHERNIFQEQIQQLLHVQETAQQERVQFDSITKELQKQLQDANQRYADQATLNSRAKEYIDTVQNKLALKGKKWTI